MADLRKFGATSNIVRFSLRNSSTGVGLTGMTNATSGLIISTICGMESTATVYTVAASNVETITTLGTYAAPTASKCRFKEVDATNHPGLYEFQIADARFAVSTAKRLVISVSGAASLLTTDYEIRLLQFDPDDAVRMGLTALPNATAGASGGVPVLDALLSIYANIVDTGTAQAGAGSTITLAAGATSTNELFKGSVVSIVSGTGAGQSRTIAGYVGSTKVATTGRAWVTNPDATSVYKIHGLAVPRVDDNLAVIVQSGTGTGQLSITSGVVSASHSSGENNTTADAILARALASETYAADGAVPTLSQILYQLWSAIGEFSISGTTITCKKLDGSTTSMTFTMDSSTVPTSRTRAT